MKNQCLIILGLYLTLSVYKIEGCLKAVGNVVEIATKCKAKWELGDAEINDLASQPDDDMRFKNFALCFYEGIGVFKDGKFSAEALKNQFEVVDDGSDPEFNKKTEEFFGKIADSVELANQKSTDLEKAYDYMIRSQTPESKKDTLSLLCKPKEE